MIKILLIIILCYSHIISQNSLKGIVKDDNSGEPIPAVNVIIKGTLTGTAANIYGEFMLNNIPDGQQVIVFSHIGYENYELSLTFPATEKYITIVLKELSEEIEEIIVNATRSSRTIENEPVRVEIIAGEEIDEKISMDPSNISMMLSESTGIQVQQISAATVNNSFSIHGLDGRYTQLLKDGFPLYSGFAGTLSIVQIPPLDLQQIEIIKGSSSVLYGGGAIAGLINLISKEPREKREISFLANGTSALGCDLSSYYSEKFKNFGVTLLGSRNIQKAYDSNDDKFSDIPEINRYSFNPRIFFYTGEKSTIETSADISLEERTGGSLPIIKGDQDSLYTYTEKNTSNRFSGRIKYTGDFEETGILTLKYSGSYFKREIILPGHSFRGTQFSNYGEAAFQLTGKNMQWIFGLNFITEDFDDEIKNPVNLSYTDVTSGLFIQNSIDFSERFILEAGLRTDYNKDYKWFILPGASFLIKITDDISGRFGGGLGYKIPAIFTESTEETAFRNLLPLKRNIVNPEKSWGINFDVNYTTIFFDRMTVSFNQLFFFTKINNPLFLTDADQLFYELKSLDGHSESRGTETNIKITLGDFKFFSGYAFIEARSYLNGVYEEFPVTPKHWISFILLYEKHENIRIGFEAYYTSKQKLSSGALTNPFWINGLMIEKRFGAVSLFLNFENFLDVKQSDYGPMFTGSPSDPEFAELYAPIDGRIINGGIKISL